MGKSRANSYSRSPLVSWLISGAEANADMAREKEMIDYKSQLDDNRLEKEYLLRGEEASVERKARRKEARRDRKHKDFSREDEQLYRAEESSLAHNRRLKEETHRVNEKVRELVESIPHEVKKSALIKYGMFNEPSNLMEIQKASEELAVAGIADDVAKAQEGSKERQSLRAARDATTADIPWKQSGNNLMNVQTNRRIAFPERLKQSVPNMIGGKQFGYTEIEGLTPFEDTTPTVISEDRVNNFMWQKNAVEAPAPIPNQPPVAQQPPNEPLQASAPSIIEEEVPYDLGGRVVKVPRSWLSGDVPSGMNNYGAMRQYMDSIIRQRARKAGIGY